MINQNVERQAVDFLSTWLSFKQQQSDLPGFVVQVNDGLRPIFSRAFGYADLATKQPLTVAHRLGIGSQAKMLTAVALMQALQQANVSLDSPVVDHVPWLQEHHDRRYRRVTLRNLLEHRSGLPRDGRFANCWAMEAPFPDADTFRRCLLAIDLVIDPGTQFKYSNIGFVLLGLVIEALAGESYESYVRKHVCRPLGLDSMIAHVDHDDETVSSHYNRQRFGLRNEFNTINSTGVFDAVAGWYATAADSAKLVNSLLSDTSMLGEADFSQLWEGEDRNTSYSKGFMLLAFGERSCLGHSGALCGFRSSTFADVKTGLVISVSGNAIDVPTVAITAGIFGVFDFFERYGSEELSPSLKRFNVSASTYADDFQIVATNERIVRVDPESWAPFTGEIEVLIVESPTTLRIEQCHDLLARQEKVEFFLDETGEVSGLDYAGWSALVR